MDQDLSLLPQAAAQMRGALSNLYFAAARLAPAAAREADPELDARAALLDQSYYRLLRLVNDLTATRYLDGEPLPLRDRDIVDFVAELFGGIASLASLKGVETRLICAEESHICAFCPDAMEQLLYQLVSNALKFTPAGGLVTVELRRTRGGWSWPWRTPAPASPRSGWRPSLTATIRPRRPRPRPKAWAWGWPCAGASPRATAESSRRSPARERGAASPSPCRTASAGPPCPTFASITAEALTTR
mgnify:CR=1 FL=1